MSIFSVVMITAFGVVYVTTYNNIQAENQRRLESVISTYIEYSAVNIEFLEEVTVIQSFSVHIPHFNIEVDKNGNITHIDSVFDMPLEVYENAAMLAWSDETANSTLNIEGRDWIYAVSLSGSFLYEYLDGQQINSAQYGYIITFLDITDSKITLASLLYALMIIGLITLFIIMAASIYFANRAIKPIAETWEKQKQFIADASHELKTPLTIIRSNYGMILSNGDETVKSQSEWLDYIRIGTDRMTKLVNDLLDLAKIEDEYLQIQKETFNLSNVVEKAVQSMDAGATEKGIQIFMSIEPDIIVNSDPEKIMQTTTILLDNAIKYTDKNGRIDVCLRKSKHRVICSVRNCGQGISSENLPKIFDRFYRADQSRNSDSGGYGLGLSIAKATMEKLGGDLYAESTENESTTFTFVLSI